MKNLKNEKTELERQLEEELRRETEAESSAPEAHEESDNGDEEVFAAEAVSDETPEAETNEAPPAERLERELAESRDQLLRMRAEFDNYRKRMAREADRMRKRAAESLLLDMLPVLDNLELALKHADSESGSLAEGVDMVLKQLIGKLEAHGLHTIPALGREFDPRIHEAVSQVPSGDYGRDTIAEEFQKGYMLGEQVLRASKVAVSIGAPAEAEPAPSPADNADTTSENE